MSSPSGTDSTATSTGAPQAAVDANSSAPQSEVEAASCPPKKRSLKKMASEIREGGQHPAARNNRTIAVGEDAEGNLFAGSSNRFDRGQKVVAEKLGVKIVKSKAGQHAEENLMREVPGLKRVGTSVRAPCGPTEHNCAQQLADALIEVEK